MAAGEGGPSDRGDLTMSLGPFAESYYRDYVRPYAWVLLIAGTIAMAMGVGWMALAWPSPQPMPLRGLLIGGTLVALGVGAYSAARGTYWFERPPERARFDAEGFSLYAGDRRIPILRWTDAGAGVRLLDFRRVTRQDEAMPPCIVESGWRSYGAPGPVLDELVRRSTAHGLRLVSKTRQYPSGALTEVRVRRR